MGEGHQFTALVEFQKCTGQSSMPMEYFTPSAIMLMPVTEKTLEFVVTSHFHFSDLLGFPVYEYVRYTFSSEEGVEVRTTLYDSMSFKQPGPSYTISGFIGSGVEITLYLNFMNN